MAAGALDRPYPQRRIVIGKVDQALVALVGGGHSQLIKHRAGAGIDHGPGMGLDVGVDADDDVDDLGQTGHCVPPRLGADEGSGPGGATAGL